MPAVPTCPNGHQWTVPDQGQTVPADGHGTCPVCGAALQDPGTTPVTRKSPAVASPLQIPALSGYQILEELGRGGMGIVYRALDNKRQKVVALKTMQWIEPQALYRFKQEFRALAGLSHPNLVSLYELVSDGRQWFFTMELLQGVPFLSHVHGPASGPASALNRLREALRQLASGILALHDAGTLHRDIKPANVLVTTEGRVVLLDFGLAADLDRAGLYQSNESHFLGTIAYMAPEQAAGQALSPASDWYAVGVMLYEALTGRIPFEGPGLEMLQAKQHRDPPAPRELRPDIPEDLNGLAMALLCRNRLQRPSGQEIMRRLGGALAHASQTVTIGPRSSALGGSLIGRKQHLRALADAFGAIGQGHPIVCHVHGPSGVGKSALVRCFLDGLVQRDEAVVLTGQCYEQEAVPYKALDSLVDALSRYLVHLSDPEAEALLPRDVAALARVFPVLRRVAAVAQAPRRPVVLADPRESRRRALTALRELLGRLGDRRPLVLFIDDLQWGDADSAALLADLLRPPEPPTLLLLVGYRSEDAGASPCLNALCGPGPSQGFDRRELAVEPLTSEECHELVVSLCEDARPTTRLVEAIARESGGNPFFVYELVQHIKQTRVERDPCPTKEVFSLIGEIALQDVLWRRVQRLPEAARRLLEVVAVAGRPLQQTDAFQVIAPTRVDIDALAQLRAARFLRSAGLAQREEIETYHDRIRETVVAHLPPATLRGYHHGLAHVLEASGQADPEFLASHFQEAGEPIQAGKYYAQAALGAADALAFDRAAKLYRLALALQANPTDQDGRINRRTLQTRLGDALANAGRGAGSAREYLAAADGADRGESLELQRRAALQFLISGHVDEGLATLRAVLGAVGLRLPATPRRAFWSLVLRRLQLRIRGLGFQPRSTENKAAVPPEDLIRINSCWTASVGLSLVDTIQGAYFHTRGLLLALTAGEPFYLARQLAMEAAQVSVAGSRSQRKTARILQIAEALAQQVDRPYIHAMVSLARGIAAACAGDWPHALSLCDLAEAIFRGSCTGVVWELDTAHRFALWPLMFMGEVAQLSRRLPPLLQEAQERDDLYEMTNATLGVGTFVRLAADEPQRARHDMEQIMARWSHHGFHVQHMNRLHDEAQIDLYQGNGQTAWDRLAAHWRTLGRLHFFRVQQVRVLMVDLRARCALAAASRAKHPAGLLRAAERDARRLQGERAPWADALSRLVRAGIELARRGAGAAALLRDSVSSLEAAAMPFHAAASRRRLGRLIGGSEGQALVAQAERWMQQQGIVNPARMSALLVPGFPE